MRSTRPVRAVDPTPATHTWTVAVPPETTVVGPASPSASTSAKLTFSADDPGATFECSLDGVSFASCVSPVELDELADGEHAFNVQATDPLGNVEPVPAGHVWTVADPPETTIDSRPSDLGNDNSPEFAFSSDEEGSSFECLLDGGDWTACASPQPYVGLADGGHTFEVRATDPAGNTDPDAASDAFTVDTQAPAVSLSGPGSLTNDATPEFTFSSEDGASLECTLGEDFAACGSPYQVQEALADGEHTFQVRASDAAGNTGDAASLAFTVDTQGPTVTLTGPSGLTKDSTPEFDFTSEDGATLRVSRWARRSPRAPRRTRSRRLSPTATTASRSLQPTPPATWAQSRPPSSRWTRWPRS